MYNTDALRWRALQNRDSLASSHFVYAVISTKIYCRPGCPSRLARRANVCFYDRAEEAVQAGYRPCLRCKPDQAKLDPDGHGSQRDAVRKACQYIEQMNGNVKFAEVAKHVGLSMRYLYGLFRVVVGMTPVKYAAFLGLGPGNEQNFSVTLSAGSGSSPGALSTTLDNSIESNADAIAWNSLINLEYTDPAVFQTPPNLLWEDFNLYGASTISSTTPRNLTIVAETCESRSYDHLDPFLPIISSQDANISNRPD